MEGRAEVTVECRQESSPPPSTAADPDRTGWVVCAGDRSPLAMPPFFRAMAAVRSNPPPWGGGRMGAAGRAGGCRAEWVGGNSVAAHLAARGRSQLWWLQGICKCGLGCFSRSRVSAVVFSKRSAPLSLFLPEHSSWVPVIDWSMSVNDHFPISL